LVGQLSWVMDLFSEDHLKDYEILQAVGKVATSAEQLTEINYGLRCLLFLTLEADTASTETIPLPVNLPAKSPEVAAPPPKENFPPDFQALVDKFHSLPWPSEPFDLTSWGRVLDPVVFRAAIERDINQGITSPRYRTGVLKQDLVNLIYVIEMFQFTEEVALIEPCKVALHHEPEKVNTNLAKSPEYEPCRACGSRQLWTWGERGSNPIRCAVCHPPVDIKKVWFIGDEPIENIIAKTNRSDTFDPNKNIFVIDITGKFLTISGSAFLEMEPGKIRVWTQEGLDGWQAVKPKAIRTKVITDAA
ncbi:MAG: hypothetical protein HQM08_29280, partial [Candidatus Riflebacteria bacterium]|nr:hypothetical protein [Candidatus Riflebacteria bacterium]